MAERFLEFLVVFQHSQALAGAVIDGGDCRGVDVGELIDEELASRAESCAVGALVAGDDCLFPFLIDLADVFFERVALCAGIVEVGAALVGAVEVGDDLLTVGELADEGAVDGVEVEVVVAVAFTHQDELVAREVEVGIHLRLDEILGCVSDNELADGAAGIGHVDVEAVLMAVLGEDGEFVLVARELYPDHIAVAVEGQIHLAFHP